MGESCVQGVVGGLPMPCSASCRDPTQSLSQGWHPLDAGQGHGSARSYLIGERAGSAGWFKGSSGPEMGGRQ